MKICIILVMFVLMVVQLGAEVHLVPQDYATIQSGINAAAFGDTVLVASGFYNERITMVDGVVLLSAEGANVTEINSTGFGGGAGSWVILANQNCIVSGFRLGSNDPFTFGISTSGTDATTVFEHNIIENMSYSAIGMIDASPVIRRNLLLGNDQNGIIMNMNSAPQVINNTIDGNVNGISVNGNSSPTILNNNISYCLNWALTSSESNSMNSYNNFWMNSNDFGGEATAGTGDIFVDPLYVGIVGPDTVDYHLLEGSPCIDAGDPASETDPDGSIADIGVYWFGHVTTDIAVDIPLPTTIELLQNYPNPFNPSTVISFHLAARSEIVVQIYDVSGRMIRELLNDTREAGMHEVDWDGRTVGGSAASSGIYFYTLRSENSFAVRSMQLVR